MDGWNRGHYLPPAFCRRESVFGLHPAQLRAQDPRTCRSKSAAASKIKTRTCSSKSAAASKIKTQTCSSKSDAKGKSARILVEKVHRVTE